MHKATITYRFAWGEEATHVVEHDNYSTLCAMITGAVVGACSGKAVVTNVDLEVNA